MRLIGSWKVLLLTILACASFHSNAQWSTLAHVTLVDGSGMGTRADQAPNAPIYFLVDQPIPGNACATTGGAQAVLFYSPVSFVDSAGDTDHPAGNERQMVNSKAVFSTLQIALVTGLRVQLLGLNGTAGYCQVTLVQLLSSP